MPTTVISTGRPPAISAGNGTVPAGTSGAASSVGSTAAAVGSTTAVGVSIGLQALRISAASTSMFKSNVKVLVFMVNSSPIIDDWYRNKFEENNFLVLESLLSG